MIYTFSSNKGATRVSIKADDEKIDTRESHVRNLGKAYVFMNKGNGLYLVSCD